MLVVITIIGTPISLLLQGCKARMQCMNNLKQLALAVHGYHGVYQILPTSKIQYVTDPYTHVLMPWTMAILP